jgi:hypothetical protein
VKIRDLSYNPTSVRLLRDIIEDYVRREIAPDYPSAINQARAQMLSDLVIILERWETEMRRRNLA